MKILPLGMSMGGAVAMLLDPLSRLLGLDFDTENLDNEYSDGMGFLYFEQ